MNNLLDQIKADREAGTPVCVKCGHPRADHHYRHPFQPSHGDVPKSRIDAMQAALLAAGELADTDTVEQMISDVFHEGGSVRDAAVYISAAFRKAIEVK